MLKVTPEQTETARLTTQEEAPPIDTGSLPCNESDAPTLGTAGTEEDTEDWTPGAETVAAPVSDTVLLLEPPTPPPVVIAPPSEEADSASELDALASAAPPPEERATPPTVPAVSVSETPAAPLHAPGRRAAKIPTPALGEILLERKLVEPEQLRSAMERHRRTRRRLGRVLVEMGFALADAVLEALSAQPGVPSTRVNAYTVNPEAVKMLPEKAARQHMAFPLLKVGTTLVVAIASPKNLHTLDDLRFASGCEIQTMVALRPRSWRRSTATTATSGSRTTRKTRPWWSSTYRARSSTSTTKSPSARRSR